MADNIYPSTEVKVFKHIGLTNHMNNIMCYINADNLKPATTSQVLEAYTDGSCVYKGDGEQGYTNEKICAYNTFTITNTGTLYAKTDISIKNVVNTSFIQSILS